MWVCPRYKTRRADNSWKDGVPVFSAFHHHPKQQSPKMRAARYYGKEDIRIEETEEPTCGPEQVKVGPTAPPTSIPQCLVPLPYTYIRYRYSRSDPAVPL